MTSSITSDPTWGRRDARAENNESWTLVPSPSAASAAAAAASAAAEAEAEEINSLVHSTAESSTITRDYSLPSSFVGEGQRSSGEDCAEQKSMTSLVSSSNQSQMVQQQHELSKGRDDSNNENTTDDADEEKEEEDDADSTDQIALRISKETRPMMHLVRLLKEMDDGKGNYHAGNTDPKGKALASLIQDFENEISLIEHRVKDEYLIMNGEQLPQQQEEQQELEQQQPPPLPPNWIALEDLASGDVYYANEATGQTQWERPGSENEVGDIMSGNDRSHETDMNISRASNMHNSDMSNNYQRDNLESSHQSDMNNSRSRNMQNSNMNNDDQRGNVEANRKSNLNNSRTSISNGNSQSNVDDNRATRNSSMSSNFNYSNRSENNFDGSGIGTKLKDMSASRNTFEDDHLPINDELPPDWSALVDPDSGETYYANEVTGETTWDKPTSEQESNNNTTPSFDDHLPPDWIALEDAQSGDTYYLNQVTMATTWERPTATDEKHHSTNDVSINPIDQLPPGWEAIYDPSCGEYYYAHESGETQWEIPESEPNPADDDGADVKSDPQDPAEGNNNDDEDSPSLQSENLPPGWFAAVDEDSGETYYCNEATGETTWDIPTEGAATGDNEESNNPLPTEEDDDPTLPPDWYAVTDPASGDTYFCNETTGETTWERPYFSRDGKVEHEILLMSRLSMNENTVYESDSVTSSQY